MTQPDQLRDHDGHPDAEAIADTYWPPDGPHSRESVTAAAATIDRLTRYLARATSPWARPPALRYGSDLYALIGELRSALGTLDQVFAQASERAGQLVDDPTLYDDRRDGHEAADTARDTQGALDAARVALGALAEKIADAHQAAGHLGHKNP